MAGSGMSMSLSGASASSLSSVGVSAVGSSSRVGATSLTGPWSWVSEKGCGGDVDVRVVLALV